MARIATLSTDGLVKIQDTANSTTFWIPADDWHIQKGADHVSLYWLSREMAIIHSSFEFATGDSIFGISTWNGITDAIAANTLPVSGGSGTGTTSVNPSDIAAGLDQSSDLEAIKISTALTNNKLDAVISELATSKSVADLVVQDTAGNFYIRQEIFNDTTNTSSVTLRNLDGSAASPAPVLPVRPAKTGKDSVIETSYISTAPGAGFAVSQSIVLVEVIDTDTRNLTGVVWYNRTTGLPLPSAPDIATQLRSLEDRTEDLLTTISTNTVAVVTNRMQTFVRCVQSGADYSVGDTLVYLYVDRAQNATGVLASSDLWYNLNTQSFFIPQPPSTHIVYMVPPDVQKPGVPVSALGGYAQVVTLDPNSASLDVSVVDTEQRGTGLITPETIRTVTANDSPEINELFAIGLTQVDGTQRTRITDGTDSVAVKPGSTSPILGDAALVVSLSGNSANMAGLNPSVTATRHGLVGGQYLATAPTLTNNQQAPLLFDVNGAIIVAAKTYPTVNAGQINPASDIVITPGKKIYRIAYTNNSTIVHFLQIHNSAAALVSGTAVPLVGLVFRIPSGSSFVLDSTSLGQDGELFGSNTRIGLSSTFTVYTSATPPNLALMSLSIKREI